MALISISRSVRRPSPKQMQRAKAVLKKADAAKKQTQKEKERENRAKIAKIRNTLAEVKKHAVAAVARIDDHIKKIQEENQEVLLKLQRYEERKKLLIDRLNARMRRLRTRLAKLTKT